MIYDSRCPECHGTRELVGATVDRTVWACLNCRRQWNEPRELVERSHPDGSVTLHDRVRFVGRGGWVRLL